MREVFDLTRPMTRETLVALGGRRVTDGWMVGEVQVEFLRSWAAGHNTAQCVWTIGDHLGTHVDAPVHVIEGAPAIDQVDLGRLVGEAFVANCRPARGRGTAEDLQAAAAGVRPGDILLLYVDEPPGDLGHFIEHQTYVTVPAARWIVEAGVTAVGVETACFEHAYQRDVYIIEGLTGLAPLAGQRVNFAAAPVPVPGSSGSPVRAFAWKKLDGRRRVRAA